MTKEEMQRFTMLKEANVRWDRKCAKIRAEYQQLIAVLNDTSITRDQRLTAEMQIQTSRFLVGFVDLLEMQADKLTKMYEQPIVRRS